MAQHSESADITFKNISWKMQQLDCSLLGNGEDWWLSKLLFIPGAHRFQLFEWIFTRLGFGFPKIMQSQSPEEIVQDLLPVIAALGVCRKNEHSLIMGTAARSDQMKFWKTVFDILWAKVKMAQDVSDSDGFNSEPSLSNFQVNVEEEYKGSCEFIHNCCSNVNISDLFTNGVKLFPIDVSEEIESILASNVQEKENLNLQQICASVSQNHGNQEDSVNCFLESCSKLLSTEFSLISKEEKSEDSLTATSAAEFSDFFNNFSLYFDENVKHVLKTSTQKFGVLGDSFSKLQSKQEQISEVLSNLSMVKLSFDQLESQSKSVLDFDESCLTQPGSLLDEYCQIMQPDKKESF